MTPLLLILSNICMFSSVYYFIDFFKIIDNITKHPDIKINEFDQKREL